MSEQRKTCKELVYAERKHEMERVRKLWTAYRNDPEAQTDEGNWTEYGLSFDYVPAGTFADQKRGYWQYQISWGGPSDEFRFFADEQLQLVKVEYWYMDWFDGACSRIGGKDLELWREIWDDWDGCGLQQSKMDEALKD